MGGTSTISGGKLCLRIDPRVPTLSGCAASRGPTIKANTVPFSWIMASIQEGLVKDWQRTQLAGYISKSLQIVRQQVTTAESSRPTVRPLGAGLLTWATSR